MSNRTETLIGGIPAAPYRETLRNIEDVRQLERVSPALAWSESFMTSDRFESKFIQWPKSELYITGIAQWLNHKKREEGHSYLLNFMGSTVVLENLLGSYTAAVTMCLTDITKTWHEEQGIHVVDGNVLIEEPWDKLHTTMNRVGIPGFSLILSAPRDGFHTKYITDNLDISWELYNRLYNLLLPGGIIMCETTEVLGNNRNVFNTWIKTIAETDPQDPPARAGYQSFLLVKNEHLPNLPKFAQ